MPHEPAELADRWCGAGLGARRERSRCNRFLRAEDVRGWPNVIDGVRCSDHSGVMADLSSTAAVGHTTTGGDVWCQLVESTDIPASVFAPDESVQWHETAVSANEGYPHLRHRCQRHDRLRPRLQRGNGRWQHPWPEPDRHLCPGTLRDTCVPIVDSFPETFSQAQMSHVAGELHWLRQEILGWASRRA